MGVNKFIIIIFILLITIESNAKLIGSIGFVSPNYPDFGRNRPSQDVSEFFDEFIESAHMSYSDAGVAVVNKLNMKRGEIIFNDIEYKNILMIPEENNRRFIKEFYKKNSTRFLKNIAKSNHVDILLYSSFNKTKLKRILNKKSSKSTLVYRIFAYDVQSNSKKSEYIMIEINDLFDSPDYDPIELQALFIENYIKIFQELLRHMKIIGSSYTETKNSAINGNVVKKNSESGNESGDW